MSLTIKEDRKYEVAADEVFTAALGAIEGLEGKVENKDEAAKRIEAKFHKTIHGKVLGDRTQIEIDIKPAAEDGSDINVAIFPLDAVGQPLKFGARKGVSRTVMQWFFAHLEHRLPKE